MRIQSRSVMRIPIRKFLVAVCACVFILVLSGCSVVKMWKAKSGNELSQTDNRAQKHLDDSVRLTAGNNEGMIQFSLTNNTNESLPLKEECFGLIFRSSRNILRGDPSNCMLDSANSVKPKATVHGRMVFMFQPEPRGDKLVYKSGRFQTYCVIGG